MEEMKKALRSMKDQDIEVEFVVIGAGLPRTGTSSTFTALEHLLPGKCHHMKRTMIGRRGENIFWPRVARGEVLEEDWKKFIKAEGLSAAVDFPMALYWKDLLKMYPNAKVLLTVRDPVRWYLSVKNTIREGERFLEESMGGFPVKTIGKLAGKERSATFTCTAPTYLGAKYPLGMFGAVDAGEETAVRFFNDWKEDVINTVPVDRLLIFEVKEGWAPLCKFLGVPQPEGPFPNTNDTAEMQKMIRLFKKVSVVIWSLAAASIASAVYFWKDQIHLPTISLH